ncbi:DUF881 domain-containing protein [Modestobacter sp. I12A-02628]|uniref:DUF881 domain-containing protein n=1 Tax=Goekera deserti TaxID=2497753 RepID=A0A7K3WGC4_9ACTN|nr:DUF881 domain-containing protein [Goekera deserti]MPQ99702.1 DUF881 domain-containing protein [Goekera deserti]NDI46288.1 DUF881 domain-containing protein [Goekera deserti]NEL54780.1 DUF881 domain-containing protein [Goekera deserti]
MTAPPGRGSAGSAPARTRSLGSSLLDQVLAETLDPSYAAAARDREARRQVATGAALAGEAVPTEPGRVRGAALVAAVMVVVGLLATVTYREAASGAQGREQVRQALIDDIGAQSDTSDQLAGQLEQLRGEVTDRRDEALASSTVGQQALADLAAAEQGAALAAVRGPGLEVTLGNAPAGTNSDPVGGNAEIAAGGLVQDRDLQLVVNALWAAGAEAISVNDQRLGPTTAIRLAGETILVDFRPVVSPYLVRAVGNRDALQEGFLDSPATAELADVAVAYGVVFEFASRDELELPAARGSELTFARPLGVVAAAVPTDRPSGVAPSPAPGEQGG